MTRARRGMRERESVRDSFTKREFVVLVAPTQGIGAVGQARGARRPLIRRVRTEVPRVRIVGRCDGRVMIPRARVSSSMGGCEEGGAKEAYLDAGAAVGRSAGRLPLHEHREGVVVGVVCERVRRERGRERETAGAARFCLRRRRRRPGARALPRGELCVRQQVPVQGVQRFYTSAARKSQL